MIFPSSLSVQEPGGRVTRRDISSISWKLSLWANASHFGFSLGGPLEPRRDQTDITQVYLVFGSVHALLSFFDSVGCCILLSALCAAALDCRNRCSSHTFARIVPGQELIDVTLLVSIGAASNPIFRQFLLNTNSGLSLV